MLGCPARNAKTLVITENEELARSLVFVISYFIRCSQILNASSEISNNLIPHITSLFLNKLILFVRRCDVHTSLQSLQLTPPLRAVSSW